MPTKVFQAIHRMRFTFAGLVSFVLLGCAVETSTTNYHIGQLGHFEYREPSPGMGGVVVGAPHGGTAPATVELARRLSARTGMGFVAAYGFKSKQISVEQPVIRSNPRQPIAREPLERRSVFPEFKEVLRRMNQGDIDLYIGIRQEKAGPGSEGMQVIASGFTFEEAELLKQAYLDVRDRVIGSSAIDKMSISLDPLEAISWQAPGLSHHGVLMVAEKGLNLRIPEKYLSEAKFSVYEQILSDWLSNDVERLVRDRSQTVPHVEVTLMDLGRFDLIPSRKGIAGIVIGAPHGSYDEYTAEIAKQLGFRTGLATVIARGFTPTEADGWRINVNRPSEKNYFTPDFEVRSSRSRKVFEAFKEIVLDAAGGDLQLYFDVHQYGVDDTIQIATVGIDSRQAYRLKQSFLKIRDKLLKEKSSVDRVELLIEPLDEVEIGAWPAKYQGILSVARKSLHIELPLHSALRSNDSRQLYIEAVTELIEHAQRELLQ